MAKKPETENTVAENAAPAAEGAAPTTEKKKGGSAIVLENGMRRVDYIRQEFAAGRKRGEIAKELGVAYQIVFAATKDMGKEAPAAEPAAPQA